MIYGVDVCEADGNLDWPGMKENGVGFSMICAGCGSGSVDLQFRKNAEACNELGIPCGAYWLSYAYSVGQAEREAQFFIETVEEFKLGLPLCMKYDYSSRRYAEWKRGCVTEEFIREMARAFCRRVEEAGYASAYVLA